VLAGVEEQFPGAGCEVRRLSWLESANLTDCDFPIDNLPYGIFRRNRRSGVGVAIGDEILDLNACAERGLLSPLPGRTVQACREEKLNALMSLEQSSRFALRQKLMDLLDAGRGEGETRTRTSACLVPLHDAEMLLPAQIGDYTDFYASIHHATRVGRLFRPENPLLPNYKYVPIAYHGRASSILISGEEIRRPDGQSRKGTNPPTFGPTRSLDYELEMGVFIGPGNLRGDAIPIAEAEKHVFGLCLVNDWSARDIQSWEYQPLGPFLSKSFATTISPWVVTLDALNPYRVPSFQRAPEDGAALDYLTSSTPDRDGFDIRVEVYLSTGKMRDEGIPEVRVSRGNLRELYWSIRQMVAHHTCNGCNLRAGDLLASGTISGAEEGSEGCLLEMKHRALPLTLPSGEVRRFLEDDDEVVLRAFAQSEGLARIGFGECRGRIIPQ